MRQFPPRGIVCLTEETVETLYLLGEQDRIVGVSGYAVRPPQVRREKPRVSAFISADIPKILALEPDLDRYYYDSVIGGPGAFMVPAQNYETFGDAILKKLITEIASNRR